MRVAEGEAQALEVVARAIGSAGNPAQYLIAQRYMETLNAISEAELREQGCRSHQPPSASS